MKCGDKEQCSKSTVQKENYKTAVDQTHNSTKIRGRIRCHEGVRIHC